MLQLKNAIRSQCSSIVSSRPSNRNQKWKKESTFLKVHRKRKVRLLSVLGIQKLIFQESFLQLKVSWLKFSSFLPEFNYFLILLFYGLIDSDSWLSFSYLICLLFAKANFFKYHYFASPVKICTHCGQTIFLTQSGHTSRKFLVLMHQFYGR